MAQQATATSRKKEVGLPAFASISASDIVRAPTVPRSVPLDLQPLLKPFKRSGRLALRIERLPQRAKLSAGRRNSDGSWSLASDELEELTYILPSNIAAAHELTVRVMKFDDGAASTLKVIQYPIAAWEETPEPAGEEDAIRCSTEQNDPILRSQLGEMQSLFAVRESELVELRAALEQIKQEKTAELEKARAGWELELNQRLVDVAARVQSDNKKERDARLSEQDVQAVAQTEARAERKLAAERKLWQLETDRRIEAERVKWLAEADKRVAAELERFKSQMERRIDAERQAWRNSTEQQQAFEAERLKTQLEQQFEAERKTWAAETERRVAAEVAQLKAQAEQQLETERQKWRAEADQRLAIELERLKAQMQQRAEAERQTWQAQGDQRSAADIERLKALAEQRIESERRAWQAEADQRVAADQLRRQAETEQRLEAERKAWRNEVEQRLEAERNVWRNEAEQRLEAERRRSEAESLVVLGKAEERWKAQENERSAAARDEWQQQSAQQLAQEADKRRRLEAMLTAEAEKSKKLEVALEALVQAKNIPTTGDEAQQLDRLRNELAQAQAAVAERDNELVRRQMDAEQERDRWRRDAEASFGAAAKSLKAEESARLDAAMAKTRAQSEEALAEMALRCEQAERALAEARSQASAAPASDDGYIESLRAEVAELRKALADQEVELGWARAALDEQQPLHLRRAGENLPIGNFEGLAPKDEETEEEETGIKRTLIRDCLLVAGLVIPLIVFYPWIAAYLPDNVQSTISTVTGGLLSAGNDRPAPVTAPAPRPAAAPPVQRPTAIVSKSVKVRATAAVKGTVVVTLQKGASVIVLEQQGNWTRVEVPAADAAGKAQQGWVSSAYLSAIAADKSVTAADKGATATVKSTTAAVKPATAAVKSNAVADKSAAVADKSATATDKSATPADNSANPADQSATPADQSATAADKSATTADQ